MYDDSLLMDDGSLLMNHSSLLFKEILMLLNQKLQRDCPTRMFVLGSFNVVDKAIRRLAKISNSRTKAYPKLQNYKGIYKPFL